jgi:hypothetical protein
MSFSGEALWPGSGAFVLVLLLDRAVSYAVSKLQ